MQKKHALLCLGFGRIFAITVVASCSLLAGSTCRASFITYHGSHFHEVTAHQYAGASDTKYWYPLFDGSTDGNTATVGGTTSTAATTYGLLDANTASFHSTWTFQREDGISGGTVAWWHTRWQFTVDDPAGVAYSISGFTENSAGETELQVILSEATGPNVPFRSTHQNGPPGTYIVGGEPIANLVYLYGSPTGILAGGKRYDFWIRANSFDVTGESAFGGGEIQLTLSRIAAVPEPSSLSLFAIGAMVFAKRFVRRHPCRQVT